MDRKQKIIFFSLIIIGILIRLITIESKDLWADEWHAIIFTDQANLAGFFSDYFSYKNAAPPLYYLFAYSFYRIFPPSTELVARFPSFLIGALTLPVVFFVTKKITDMKTAFYILILFTFNLFQIDYSTQTRYYSLVILLSIFSVYFFYKADKEPENRLYRFQLLSINFLLYFTHNLSILFIFIEYCYLYGRIIVNIKNTFRSFKEIIYKNFVIEIIIFAILVLSRIKLFIDEIEISWLPIPVFSDFVNLYETYLRYIYFKPYFELRYINLLFFLLLIGSIFFYAIISKSFWKKLIQVFDEKRGLVWLFLLTVLFLPMVSFLVSQYKQMFYDRYFACMFFLLMLFVAELLSKIPNRVAFSFLTVLSVFSLLSLFLFQNNQENNCEYDKLFLFFRSHPNISFYYDHGFVSFNYYERKYGYDFRNVTSVGDGLSVENLNPAFLHNTVYVEDWLRQLNQEFLPKDCVYGKQLISLRCFDIRQIECAL